MVVHMQRVLRSDQFIQSGVRRHLFGAVGLRGVEMAGALVEHCTEYEIDIDIDIRETWRRDRFWSVKI